MNYLMGWNKKDPGHTCIIDSRHLPIAQYRYFYHEDGGVSVLFHNDRTGEERTRRYKTQAIAQGQITRFVHRVARIYGNAE